MGMTNPTTVHYGMWDGSSIVICAYALTLILVTVKRKEYPHVFMLFVPASVIFLTVLYFPPIYRHLPMTYDSDQRQIFRRVRWVLMMLPVLSFGATYVFTKMKRHQKAVLAIVGALLMLASVFYTSEGQEEYGFWDRTNAQDHLYKIPQTAKAMGDTILKKSGEYLAEDRKNVVHLLISDDRKGEWESSMEYIVKQLQMYVAPVRYEIITITEKDYNNPGFNIKQYITDTYDYVFCPDDERLVSNYIKNGYKVEWQMGDYCFLSGSTSEYQTNHSK